MKADITVCVPTFNSEKTLGLCLDSIMSQTVQPKEVLVCDGGSSDATLEIAEMFNTKIVGRNVKGVGKARARLLKHVHTSLIAWIDADATVPRNWIKRHVKAHKIYNADCISGPAKIVNLAGAINGADSVISNGKFIESNVLSWTALTMRKQIILDVGGFDSVFEFDGDFDLSIRLKRCGAKMLWCDSWPSYHVSSSSKTLRKSLLAGNYILYLLKYGFAYVKWNPRHFVSFVLRLSLLYSIFVVPFNPLIGLVLFLVISNVNWIAHVMHEEHPRVSFLLEQLLKAVGEHRNLIRWIKHKTFSKSENWYWM